MPDFILTTPCVATFSLVIATVGTELDYWDLSDAEAGASLFYSLIEDERAVCQLTGALESEVWHG